jgi:hypothetical protein
MKPVHSIPTGVEYKVSTSVISLGGSETTSLRGTTDLFVTEVAMA